jgi:hypothetical protein
MTITAQQPQAQEPPLQTGNVTPENELPADFNGASRDELLAALNGVDIANEGTPQPGEAKSPPTPEIVARVTKSDKTADANAAPQAAGAPPAAPDLENAPPLVREILERQAKQAERDAQARASQSEAARLVEDAKARAQQEADKIIADARAKADAEYRAKLAQVQDPHSMLQGLDVDARRRALETLALSPEQARLMKLEGELAELRKVAPAAQTALEEYKKIDQQRQEQMAAAQRAQTEQMYLGEVKDKAPTLRGIAEEAAAHLAKLGVTKSADSILLERGHAAADFINGVNAEAIRRGEKRVASVQEVVQYLEWEASRKASPPVAGGTAAKQPTAGRPGSRTVTNGSASERRASPKPIREMTAAEERQALIDVAEEAIK